MEKGEVTDILGRPGSRLVAVSTKLTSEDNDRLKRLANGLGTTKSALIYAAVMRTLEAWR